jgi:hypothetical protein
VPAKVATVLDVERVLRARRRRPAGGDAGHRFSRARSGTGSSQAVRRP